MPSSIFKKVGVASLIMMASVFLSRVLGLVREMVIAGLGGMGVAVDAYQTAFILPEILNHIAASGFLSITFIPIFSHYLARDREAEGWRVFSIIMTVFGGLLIAAISAAWAWTPEIVDLIAPGRDDPVFKAAAIRMTRIILPAQFFFFTGGLFMAVQFSRERFAIPALAPLIYNLGIILGGVCLAPWLGMEGFSWGVLAGAFAGNFALQFIGARRVGMRPRLCFDATHPDLKKYILLTLPLMLGLTMTFSTEVLFKYFGSFLPTGGIAGLNYGMRTMLILVAFFGQAVGAASYPFMARLAADGKRDEMNRLLNDTLRCLALVIPFSALIIALRHEVILILFQRGAFDAAAAARTAPILLCFMVGAAAFTAQTVVSRGYYAMQDTLSPAIYTTISVLISIPLYELGRVKMGAPGVALAASLSAILQVGLLYTLWNRRSDNREGWAVFAFFGRVLLFSIPLGLFLDWLRRVLSTRVDADALVGALVVSAAVGAVFTAIVWIGGRLFNVKEIAEITDRIIGKIKGGARTTR
ncbi:MAG: murein biosynthesis integral membrane protein MurJ [Desulfobacterales bacterium]|nr:murein biosynthesis integral membrane protein MurJ [Desulfobacterales bacterium]